MPAENGSGRGLKISVRAVYRSLEADLKSDNSLFFSILTHNSPLLLPALTTAWFWWFPPPCHSRQERDNGISLYHQPSDGMQWCQTAAAVFKPQHRKVCTRHLHCKHLFSVSAASDVLLRDATLVITNLCLLKPGGPWVLLRHYENKQTDSSHKGNDTHLLCLSGNGLCRHESNRHTHTRALEWKKRNTQNRQEPFYCRTYSPQARPGVECWYRRGRGQSDLLWTSTV